MKPSKKKKRVLITSASKKVWLIKAFQEAGWYVTAQDQDINAVALKFADQSTQEVNNPLISSLCDLLVPTRDAELGTWYSDVLHLRILRPSDETLEICLDKLEFHDWCLEHNFKTPHIYYVKPRYSQSRRQFPKEQVWEHVWQDCLSGDEYSVDLFADFESTVISIVPRKRIKTVAGESWVTETIASPLLTSESKELAEKLRLIGHNVLQCFWSGKEDEKPIWTDINCRFGGASALAIRSGCISPRWLLQIINGHAIKPKIGQYKVGLKMYRYTEDYFEETALK